MSGWDAVVTAASVTSSTTSLPAGFYVVRITGEVFAASRRVVLAR
jgi:hypothetical protein